MSELIDYFKKFQNLDKLSLSEKKECYHAILANMDILKIVNMNYWEPSQLNSFNEFITTISNPHPDQDKNTLSKIIYSLVSKDKELRLAIKWFFKKEYFKEYFYQKKTNYHYLGPMFFYNIKFYPWIFYKYFHLFVDHSLLKELNLFKEENELTSLEEEVKIKYIERKKREMEPKRNSLRWNCTKTPEQVEKEINNNWRKIRHDFFWGRSISSFKLQVDYAFKQIKRLEKALKPLYPIILSK